MRETLITALWYYFAAVNILLYILMGVDKFKALKHKRRIPEKLLFLFAIIGGALGGTLGMLSFRHKTKHWYFEVFFPLLSVLDLALVFYLILK